MFEQESRVLACLDPGSRLIFKEHPNGTPANVRDLQHGVVLLKPLTLLLRCLPAIPSRAGLTLPWSRSGCRVCSVEGIQGLVTSGSVCSFSPAFWTFGIQGFALQGSRALLLVSCARAADFEYGKPQGLVRFSAQQDGHERDSPSIFPRSFLPALSPAVRSFSDRYLKSDSFTSAWPQLKALRYCLYYYWYC